MSSYSHTFFFYPERVDILIPDFRYLLCFVKNWFSISIFFQLLYSIVYSARWVSMGLNLWLCQMLEFECDVERCNLLNDVCFEWCMLCAGVSVVVQCCHDVWLFVDAVAECDDIGFAFVWKLLSLVLFWSAWHINMQVTPNKLSLLLHSCILCSQIWNYT